MIVAIGLKIASWKLNAALEDDSAINKRRLQFTNNVFQCDLMCLEMKTVA